MENITTTTSKYFFYTLNALDLSFKYAYILVVYFIIISKIKMKIHYEFITIKIYRSSQQKAKKHYFFFFFFKEKVNGHELAYCHFDYHAKNYN